MTAFSEPTRVVVDPQVLTYRAVVSAPAAELFAILQNPHRHHEADGSGTVKAEVEGPAALALGDSFTTRMTMFGLNYAIKNRVTGLEQDRLVEWEHPGGHRWRWEFEDLGDGTTLVTESWIRKNSLLASGIYLALGAARRNDDGIRASLLRLQKKYNG